MRALGTIYGWHVWAKNAAIAVGRIILGTGGAVLGTYLVTLLAADSYWGLLIALVPILLGADQIIKGFPALSRRFTDAPGTARMGKMRDLKEAGLVGRGDHGLYCGLFNRKPVFYRSDRHVITVGPSRSGKDTGLLVPNLKYLRRSIIVVDPKAELAAITANYRRKLGPVLVINPFGTLTGNRPHLKSCGFNPLLEIKPDDSRFFAKSMGLAEAMIKIEGNDPHWTRSARALVCALIMYAKIYEKQTGTLATVGNFNKMLTLPYSGTGTTLQEMMREISEHPFRDMAQLASRFVSDNREVRSVISSAHGQTAFLNDGALIEDMAKHPTIGGKPFDFEMLKHQIVTVYIVLPDDMLATHAIWLRLIVASALNALKRSGPGEVSPVLMLNEVGNLGHLEPLESGMGMAAGKGVTIWTVWQSLSQITHIYGQHGFETFMSGAGVLNSFGAGDMETAKYLSERVGSKTEIVSSYNQTPQSKTFGKGESPSGFPLRRPEDIIALKGRKLLSWIEPSSVPFELDAPGYFDLDGMHGLDPNPYRREPNVRQTGWLGYGKA
jgi:type IV secretion system protein VirD4